MVLFGCLFSACRKEIDAYYERPDSLEPTIFDNLTVKGQFTSYLSLVEKAGYKDILASAGYFTVFAPINDAFTPFLQEHSLTSVEDIDTITARNIVRYSLVYNAFTKDQLDDYQSTDEQGWEFDNAFKRVTSYYKWVYDETVEGGMEKVVDQNGVRLLPDDGPYFAVEDNNNKSIPYFTAPYMTNEQITEYDYTYFFPESEYTDFNVVNAKVTESDILCENGIVHAIDKVILPLRNIDELLASNDEYSEFKKVIDDYIREFNPAPSSFLDRYEQVHNKREDIYIKEYPLLNFAPNCENFMRYGGGETYDAQIDGWTMFAPDNAAVKDFMDNVFLKYYGSLDNMSPQIIAEFINAHLFRTTVWPSKFETTTNMFGEPARFDPEANIIQKEFGSNGAFYGTNIVQETDAFYTALGPIILNPDYTLMLQALYDSELFYIVKNTGIKLTVFLINNAAFDSLGLSFNDLNGSWDLDNEELGSNANVAVNRLINMHVALGEHPSFITDALVETYGGEYIRHNYGFVWAAGNVEQAETVIASKKTSVSNGLTYIMNTPFRYSIDNIGRQIEGNSNFGKFYSYLKKSASSAPGYVYDPDTKEIANFKNSENNTLLIPSNAAIDSAVLHGALPSIGFADFTQVQQDQLLGFVMYHVLTKVIATNNGEVTGDRETLFKTPDGKTYVNVFNDGTNFGVIDNQGRAANVILTSSNVLANRAVIHLVDNYLKY